jgi:hypothetical protein
MIQEDSGKNGQKYLEIRGSIRLSYARDGERGENLPREGTLALLLITLLMRRALKTRLIYGS